MIQCVGDAAWWKPSHWDYSLWKGTQGFLCCNSWENIHTKTHSHRRHVFQKRRLQNNISLWVQSANQTRGKRMTCVILQYRLYTVATEQLADEAGPSLSVCSAPSQSQFTAQLVCWWPWTDFPLGGEADGERSRVKHIVCICRSRDEQQLTPNWAVLQTMSTVVKIHLPLK